MHEKNKAEAEKLEKFVNEALAFNKKHNIFVRESTKEVYEKDVYDCLPVLQKINNSDKILDLGSGGGFPGIIIAILKPMCEIHLLEKSKKKCYFLNKTIDLLGLKNAKVLNTVISKNNSLGSYTLITARAFSSTFTNRRSNASRHKPDSYKHKKTRVGKTQCMKKTKLKQKN